MTLKNNLYYENYESNSGLIDKIRDHSMYNTWKCIADYLMVNHMHDNILQVESGAGYLLYFMLNRYQFSNVHGIDMRNDLIEKFQRQSYDYRSNVKNYNFFRLSEKELRAYDVFIFSKLLEYCENDTAYLDAIPKGRVIVALYPSHDDGLCLKHFDSLSTLESYLQPYINIDKSIQIDVFKNSEYMIDSKMNVIFGTKK